MARIGMVLVCTFGAPLFPLYLALLILHKIELADGDEKFWFGVFFCIISGMCFDGLRRLAHRELDRKKEDKAQRRTTQGASTEHVHL